MQSTKETQRVLLALFFGQKLGKHKKRSVRVAMSVFNADSDIASWLKHNVSQKRFLFFLLCFAMLLLHNGTSSSHRRGTYPSLMA
jgi:hypothetical protein